MTTAALPAPPPEREELVIDTSEGTPVRALRGRNGALIRLTDSARGLIDRVRQGMTFEEIAREASASGPPVTAEAAEAAYRGLIERIERIEERSPRPQGAFWLRLPLVSSRAATRVAEGLTFAFHPAAAAGALVFGALAAASVWPLGHALAPASFAPAFALFLLSAAVHELGHAAACARFGARPGDIGLTFYLLYPAFYSDVNDAWTLRRWQRVVVDLGGVYFQLLAGAAFAFIYAASGWEPARVAVVFVLASTLFSLNPIFKFDGYWVVADALGVTNLGGQPLRLLRHAVARLRRQSPPPLPWPAPVVWVLTVYAAASIVLWSVFVIRLAPHLASVLSGYVALLSALASALAAGSWPSWSMLHGAAASTYLLVFAALMAWRLLRWPAAHLRR